MVRACLVAQLHYPTSHKLSAARLISYNVLFCLVFGSSYEPSRAQLRLCLVGSMTSALPYKNKKPSGPYKVSRKAIRSLGVASTSGAAAGGESRREEQPASTRGAAAPAPTSARRGGATSARREETPAPDAEEHGSPPVALAR
jgi:hypothetical protein